MNLSKKTNFPIFDEKKETLSQFMKRVKEFEFEQKRKKYNLILEFINVLVAREYKSLMEFVNVPREKLLNQLHNRTIMTNYSKKLSETLGINLLKLTHITSDPNDKTSKIVIYINRILKPIEYSLVSKIIDDNIYFSIKNMTKL